MQGESRTSSLLECYAEPQLILYKDTTILLCINQRNFIIIIIDYYANVWLR